MAKDHYRLVIVGAGSAGLAAADFSARLGVSVALIEREHVGGTCINEGYQSTYQTLFVLDRPDNKQVRVIYGNDQAAAARPGDFPTVRSWSWRRIEPRRTRPARWCSTQAGATSAAP